MRTHKQNYQLIYICVEGTRVVERNSSDFKTDALLKLFAELSLVIAVHYGL